jgi:hypothetical protein
MIAPPEYFIRSLLQIYFGTQRTQHNNTITATAATTTATRKTILDSYFMLMGEEFNEF